MLYYAICLRVQSSSGVKDAANPDERNVGARRLVALGSGGMSLDENIAQYIEYFREQLPEVAAIASPLYRKALFVTMLDCLSRAAFPNVDKHRVRFVSFIDACSGWGDKDRVSAPQLKLALDDNGITSGLLFAAVCARLSAWSEGQILRPDSDPAVDELRALANAAERPLVEQARYAELLYTYRNHLVHEFRQPGYGIELSADLMTPYYHGMIGSPWELVFPTPWFRALCEDSIAGLEGHLRRNRLNPYDAYQFGTLWQRR